MKTTPGAINNNYSKEMKAKRNQEIFNDIMNVIIATMLAIGIALIISFLTIPR